MVIKEAKYLKLHYRLDYVFDVDGDYDFDDEDFDDSYEAEEAFDEAISEADETGLIELYLYEVKIFDYSRGEEEEELIKEWVKKIN